MSSASDDVHRAASNGVPTEAHILANALRQHTGGRPCPADQSALQALLECLAPLPARWVDDHGLGSLVSGWVRRAGLAYGPRPSAWQARCTRPDGQHLPWLLWSALRSLGMDDPRCARLIVVSDDPARGLARFHRAHPASWVRRPCPADRSAEEGERRPCPADQSATAGGTHDPLTVVLDCPAVDPAGFVSAPSSCCARWAPLTRAPRDPVVRALAYSHTTRLCLRRTRPGDILVRIGGSAAGVVTPGGTVEERAQQLGFPVGRRLRTWAPCPAGEERSGATAPVVPVSVASWPGRRWALPAAAALLNPADPNSTAGRSESRVGEVVDAEAEHALRWLRVRRDLGLVALLGPLTHRLATCVMKGRADGSIGQDGLLTRAGWWRLAYGGGQGVGPVELRRAARLGAMVASRRRHLRITQRICLRLMAAGAVPLGAEETVSGEVIAQVMPQRWRSDALLLDADGALVWVEVMLRAPNRLGERSAPKYAVLERTFLPTLAEVLQRPVRLHTWLAGHERSLTFQPSAEPA